MDLEIDILYRVVRKVLKAEKKGHLDVITIALLINRFGYNQIQTNINIEYDRL